jgi:hypothetical protein
MLIAIALFTICQALVLLCCMELAKRWYRRERDALRSEISEALRSFVEPPNEETPSPLAVLIDQMALLLAGRMVQQIKAMLAGVESGESKGEQLQLIESVSAGNPLLGLLAGILPKRIRNKFLSNPQMLGALSKLGGGSSNGNHDADYVPRKHH